MNFTMHGWSNFASSNNITVKIVWTLLILTSLSAGLYNIGITVNDYYKFDVITNIARADARSIQFPAITVCTKDMHQERLSISNSQVDVYTNFYNISFLSFIENPTFKNKELNKSFDLEYFKIPKSYGNCVRFKNLAKDSVTDELEEFILNISRYVEYSKDIRWQKFNYFEFYISDTDLNSFLDLLPTKLYFAYDHQIGIIRTEVETKLPSPYNPCLVEVPDLQINCIEKCINNEIASKYNCSIPSYYTVEELDECFSKPKFHPSKINNFDSVLYDNYISSITNLTTLLYPKCENKCPKECQTARYSTRISQENRQDNDKTNFKFFIFDFSSLVINQIPKMSTFSLVSSIGGNFGLFIGISFLSFFEFFEFLIKLFQIIY